MSGAGEKTNVLDFHATHLGIDGYKKSSAEPWARLKSRQQRGEFKPQMNTD